MLQYGLRIWCLLQLLCQVQGTKSGKINRKLFISSVLNPLANTNDSTVGSGLYENEVFTLLAEKLNFTFDVVKLNDSESGGIYVNGTWTGAMGQLIRKEIDIFTTAQGLSSFRNQWVDFSYPIRFEDMVIIQPFPNQRNSAVAMFDAFTWQVWLASAASVITVVFVLWFLQDPASKKQCLDTWIIVYISYILGQESAHSDKRTSTRIIYVVCFLTTVVMTSAFIAAYTARLTFPQHVYLVDSIEDLAAKPDIKVHVVKGFTVENLFMRATDGSMKIIADRIRDHPDWKIGVDQQKNLSRLIQGRVAMPQPRASAESRLWNDYKETQECRLSLAKKSFYNAGYSMMLQKGSPLTVRISSQIMRMYEAGLMQYAARRSYPANNPCAIKSKQGKRGQRDPGKLVINLTDFGGAFLLLVCGLGLSTFVFVVELITHRRG